MTMINVKSKHFVCYPYKLPVTHARELCYLQESGWKHSRPAVAINDILVIKSKY